MMMTLANSECSANPRLLLLPLKDQLYAFWCCLSDSVFDEEIRNIVYCGRSVERLDLYIRTNYPHQDVRMEYERLCKRLKYMPEHTPYYGNPQYLEKIGELIDSADTFAANRSAALDALSRLFETSEVTV